MQLLLLVFTFTVVFSFDNNRYCNLRKCPNGSHTMCIYQNEDVARSCRRQAPSNLIREEELLILLEAHNDYRLCVYTGEEDRGNDEGQPGSTRISLLEWDEELARSAQRWSNQCLIKNDLCRNTEDHYVGQNFIHGRYNIYNNRDQEIYLLSVLVDKWYYEFPGLERSIFQSFNYTQVSRQRALNYTQMLWQNTTRIGCGITRFYNDEQDAIMFLVCNYAPKGNINGEPVYAIAN